MIEIVVSLFFAALTGAIPFLVRSISKLLAQKTKIQIDAAQEEFLRNKAYEAVRYAEEKARQTLDLPLNGETKKNIAVGYLQAESLNAPKGAISTDRANRLVESTLNTVRPSLPPPAASVNRYPSAPPMPRIPTGK